MIDIDQTKFIGRETWTGAGIHAYLGQAKGASRWLRCTANPTRRGNLLRLRSVINSWVYVEAPFDKAKDPKFLYGS